MKLLRKADYTPMPWKNGMGTTLQIDIDTETHFLWRLSMARVHAASPFSEYKGYDRLLSIWQGKGLLLNGFELKPGNIFKFKGEDPINCQNLSSEVIDLGFMYQRDKAQAQMSYIELTENKVIDLHSDLHFLFCAEGEFSTALMNVSAGDTLKIQKAASLAIELKTPGLKLLKIDVRIL